MRDRTIGSYGFTLMELSISLIIIALVAGATLFFGMQQLEIVRTSQTYDKLTILEDALLAYGLANGRLPCPASFTVEESDPDFGTELYGSGSIGDGECDGSVDLNNTYGRWGAVPVKALGLPNQLTYDGWDRRFSYAVDKRMTAFDAFTDYPASDTSVHTLTLYDATLSDRAGAIYVLVSYGNNGHGAYSKNGTRVVGGSTNAAEAENCNCDSFGNNSSVNAEFVDQDYYVDPSDSLDTFDDIVRFKLRSQMRSQNE